MADDWLDALDPADVLRRWHSQNRAPVTDDEPFTALAHLRDQFAAERVIINLRAVETGDPALEQVSAGVTRCIRLLDEALEVIR